MTLNLGKAHPWVGAGVFAGNGRWSDLVTPCTAYGGLRVNARGRAGVLGPPPQPTVPGAYLTAPAITPDTNCRWNAKNTASGITMEMKAPGARISMLLPNCRTCCCRATVSGCDCESENTSATSMSFHTQRNWKIPRDAI